MERLPRQSRRGVVLVLLAANANDTAYAVAIGFDPVAFAAAAPGELCYRVEVFESPAGLGEWQGVGSATWESTGRQKTEKDGSPSTSLWLSFVQPIDRLDKYDTRRAINRTYTFDGHTYYQRVFHPDVMVVVDTFRQDAQGTRLGAVDATYNVDVVTEDRAALHLPAGMQEVRG